MPFDLSVFVMLPRLASQSVRQPRSVRGERPGSTVAGSCRSAVILTARHRGVPAAVITPRVRAVQQLPVRLRQEDAEGAAAHTTCRCSRRGPPAARDCTGRRCSRTAGSRRRAPGSPASPPESLQAAAALSLSLKAVQARGLVELHIGSLRRPPGRRQPGHSVPSRTQSRSGPCRACPCTKGR